jgi:putative mRNA 3-end processing factor
LLVRPGGFLVDPVRPVDLAVITHGRSDHARPGHRMAMPTMPGRAVAR